MQIDLYQGFYKKENSTKRPVAGSGVSSITVTGHLKEPCSVLHPVISFQASVNVNATPDSYRYAYIPLFSRYYWVDEWIWNDGLWEVHLDVDVLATYKTIIGETTEYILRTDSTDPGNFNGAISDTTYPALSDVQIEQTNFRNPFVDSVSLGTYVVGIICSEDDNAVGAVTYYALTPSEFGDLKDTLFGIDGLYVMGLVDSPTAPYNWTATDIGEQIFKTMYNPFQYIVSCSWFPVDPSDIPGTAVSTLKIGWWIYTVSGKRMTQTVGNFADEVVQLPSHPQYTRGRYLNHAPYTQRTLYGKFGSIPIDTSYFDLDNPIVTDPYQYLANTYSVDYVTGQCLFQVFASRYTTAIGRKLIHKTEFLIGVPIQLAQIGTDFLGAVSTSIKEGGNIASSAITGYLGGGAVGAIAGGIASAGTGIYNILNSAMPQLETSGVNGSFIANELSTTLISKYYVVVEEDITHRGRPLCSNRRIDTLSGFIQCAEGDVDLNAYDSERREVKRFLTEGFFWE